MEREAKLHEVIEHGFHWHNLEEMPRDRFYGIVPEEQDWLDSRKGYRSPVGGHPAQG